MGAIEDYRAALTRLLEGKPERVARGTRITNDAVALEAGRKKGSIKKGREVFADLIDSIQAAALKQQGHTPAERKIIKEASKDTDYYKKMYEDSLSREVALVHELFRLRTLVKKLQSGPRSIGPKHRPK